MAFWAAMGLIVLASAGWLALPGFVERRMNLTLQAPPYGASSRARTLHQELVIADLHADTLLWKRDPLTRSTRGHVDIPRLIEGNVAVQAFTIVTQVPYGMNLERNGRGIDMITALALVQGWPPRTWGSLAERALYQARRLGDAATRSEGRFTLIRTAGDLTAYLERRTHSPGITAGILGIEGAHALDGDLDNLDRMFDAGVRMVAPTHFFDNDIGGSAHGIAKGGLTDKGRADRQRAGDAPAHGSEEDAAGPGPCLGPND